MSSNIILISGDDAEQIRKLTATAVKNMAGEQADEFSLDMIKESDDSTPLQLLSDLIKSIQTPSFFGTKTVCMGNCNFLDREGAKTDKSPLAVQFRVLSDLISDGVPQDINLIISGPAVDTRKSLHKACKKAGAQISILKKIQLMGKWEQQVSSMIQQASAQKGMRLARGAVDYLTKVIGTEVGRIEPEMEKIFCACGHLPQINYQDICDISVGNASTAFWAFSNALGDRNLQDTYRVIENLLHQTKDPDGTVMGLLLQTSRHFSLLLKGKIFMQQAKLKSPDAVKRFMDSMSAEQKEQFKNNEFAKLHPYRAMNMAKSAMKYSGPELIEAMRLLTQTNRQLVSSPVSRRLLLEQLAFAIIKGRKVKV